MDKLKQNFSRIHIFFPGGAGGNFLFTLLSQMYDLPLTADKTKVNEFLAECNKAIGKTHLIDLWDTDKQYVEDCLTQRKYPPGWNNFLDSAKKSKTHFIILNSKDSYYTQNLAGLKGSFTEGWQDKFYIIDRATSGRDQKWDLIWGHYKWLEEQFIENNIPCLYLEYHDLYLDKVKESLEKICNMWGPVDNLDKYVKMINEYSKENYRLLKEYKSDIYFSRHG